MLELRASIKQLMGLQHRLRVLSLCFSLAAGLIGGIALSQSSDAPVRAVPDPEAVTTRQILSPARVQAVVKGRVYGLAFGENSAEVFSVKQTAPITVPTGIVTRYLPV
jgi:hypothetical protein